MTNLIDIYNNIAVGKNGEDLLLVSVQSNIELGRMMSLQYRHRFFVPRLGGFLSPISFVLWVQTGNEDYRNNDVINIRVDKELWEQGRLYAKFAQLSALKNKIIKNYGFNELDRLTSLPWLTFKRHPLGLAEKLPDERYNGVLKEMLKYLVEIENKPDWNASFEDFSLNYAKKVVYGHISRWFTPSLDDETYGSSSADETSESSSDHSSE